MKVLYCILLFSVLWASKQDLRLAKRYFKDEVYGTSIEHYLKFLEKASEDDKALPEARLQLARAYTQQQDWPKASRAYQDFLVSFSTHKNLPDATLERAEVLGKWGKHAQAAEMYYAYYSLKTGDWLEKSLYLSAYHAWEARNREEAKRRIEQYLQKYPKGRRLGLLYHLQAKVSLKEGASAKAADSFEMALPLVKGKEKKEVLWGWGKALVKSGEFERAQKAYAKVLEQANAKDSSQMLEEYSSLLEQAKKDSLLVSFLESRSLPVLSEVQILRLAQSYLRLQKYAKLKEVLLQQEKKSQVLGVLLAKAYLGLGERALGIQLLEELASKGYGEAWLQIAQTYLEDGLYLKSIRSWNQALKAFPDSLQFLLHVAQTYEEKLQRHSTARTVYEDFVREYPDHILAPQAAMGVSRSFEKEKKVLEAVQAYHNVELDYPASALAFKAKTQRNYLQRFQVKNQEAALKHILIVMEEDSPKRLLQMARIYASDLKDFEKSRELLELFAQKNPSMQAIALYQKGNMEKALYEKSLMEQNTSVGNTWKAEALSSYGLVLALDSNVWKDDARYFSLTLKPFALLDYENFLKEYPKSNRLPEALLAIGQDYLKKGKDLGPRMGAKSLQYFQRILNAFPKSSFRAQALLGAAQAHHLKSERKQARAMLSLFQQSKGANDNEKAAALVLTGKIWSEEKQYEEAVRAYQKVLYKYRLASSTPRALFRLAESFKVLEKHSKAEDAWKQYIARYPQGESYFSAFRELALLQEEKQNWKRATESYLDYLSKNPKHADRFQAHEYLGFLYVRLNSKKEAVSHFQKAILGISLPRKREAWLKSGDLYLQLDKFPAALAVFDSAMQHADLARDSSKALGGKLAALAMLGKKKKFQKGYKVFRNRFEDAQEIHARILYYDGRYLMEAKQEKRARKRFQYLSDKFDETSWAAEGNYYLGDLSFRRSKYEEAVRLLQSYLKQSPDGRNSENAQFKLGGCFFQLGKYKASAEAYEKVVLSPKGEDLMKYRATYNAALAWEKIGNWSAAAAKYKTIFADYSQFQKGSSVLVSAGFSWFNGGEYTKAKNAFAEALLDTSSERLAEAHYWYAKSLDKLENVEEALSEYLKVSYLYNGDGMWGLTALFEVGQIYQRSGDKARAAKMYRKIVQQDGKSGTLGRRAAKLLERLES